MNGETPVVGEPVVGEPVVGEPVAKEAVETAPETKNERTWSEEIELAGTQLVDQVKEWIAEGNVRRLILRTPDNRLVLEIPLVTGAVVGGVLTFFAPLLAVVGAIASVIAKVKVEVVRIEEPDSKA
ncbi:MAG: DUF4342 domain-containing protein [Caldilineaceae bacterium]|nr:DUF4342 domain-containing protein [Caldilineaceae bacterium]